MMLADPYPQWQEFEDLVFEALSEENLDWTFQKNIKLQGLESGTKRQIDILATGKIAGHDARVVIDCKHYKSKLDVNDIGRFSSLLDDVSADIGVLVTEKGFSPAAERLAQRNRIKLEIRNLESLRSFDIIDICNECYPGDDHFPGVIDWCHPEIIGFTEKELRAVGWCDRCNTIFLKCGNCSEVTSIIDVLYGDWIECVGGCGSRYLINFGDPGDIEHIDIQIPEND